VELHINAPSQKHARFDAFTAVKVQVEICWIVTTHSVVVGYQRFGGPGFFHLHKPEDIDMNTQTWSGIKAKKCTYIVHPSLFTSFLSEYNYTAFYTICFILFSYLYKK
jgi:hypothetical protein